MKKTEVVGNAAGLAVLAIWIFLVGAGLGWVAACFAVSVVEAFGVSQGITAWPYDTEAHKTITILIGSVLMGLTSFLLVFPNLLRQTDTDERKPQNRAGD